MPAGAASTSPIATAEKAVCIRPGSQATPVMPQPASVGFSRTRCSAGTSTQRAHLATRPSTTTATAATHVSTATPAGVRLLREQLDALAAMHRPATAGPAPQLALFSEALKAVAALTPSERQQRSSRITLSDDGHGAAASTHQVAASRPAALSAFVYAPSRVTTAQDMQKTLTHTVQLLNDKLRPWASTTARGEAEGLAMALDAMLSDAVAQDGYLSATLGNGSNGNDGNAALLRLPERTGSSATATTMVPRAPSGASRRVDATPPGGAVPRMRPPPFMEDSDCLSQRTDATSIVQNHSLGATPSKVDIGTFLSSQGTLANILFAGMGELVRQVGSHCMERSVVLDTLSSALASLLSNAHEATWYYVRMYEDVAAMKLEETVKDLTTELTAAAAENKRLQEQVTRLEQDAMSFEQIRLAHDRLQRRQVAVDQFLKEQLERNAVIMRMATQATGGVIPAHVVAAMTGGYQPQGNPGGSAYPSGFRQGHRRSTRSRSMVGAMRGSDSDPHGQHQGYDFAQVASIHNFDEPNSGGTSPSRPNLLAPSGNVFTAPPFFVQGNKGASDDPSLATQQGTDEESSEMPFSDDLYETADAAVQTGVEDAVNAQLVGEMHAYFAEMDKAAQFSQVLCRVVYGTTDFYNPAECCENARRMLDDISQRAQESKDIHSNAADGRGGKGGGLHRGAATSGAASRANFVALIGHIELHKESMVRLIQYGSNAAREMRLRFGSMAESDSFRRAVEWRPPRGPRDPCRLCLRQGPLPEEQAALAEAVELRSRVATLEGELAASKAEVEKMFKRVEHESQIAQSHSDALHTIFKAKKAMQPAATQTDVAVRYAVAAQTDATTQNNPMWSLGGHQGPAGSGFGQLSAGDGEASLAVTPVVFLDATGASHVSNDGGSQDRSPFASADAEWSQFRSSGRGVGGGGQQPPDGTFLTKSAAVSARRRSSIEVTFDRDVLQDTESPSASVVSRQLSAERRGTVRGGVVSPTGDVFGANQQPVLRRQQSEFSIAALKYRDALIAFNRGGSGGGRGGSAGRSSFRDRTSPVDLDNVAANAPLKSHNWAIRMMGSIYRSRYASGGTGSAGSDRTSTPETSHSCSRHFTDFLRQTFGAKAVIDDNAGSFLRSVHQYAADDPRFALFSKLFSDEYHRDVYRTFLNFSAMLDQSLSSFDPNAATKKGDELAEPCTVPLEAILHCVQTLYWNSDRIYDRDEFCHLLATKAVEISRVVAEVPVKGRRASVVPMKAFEAPTQPAVAKPLSASSAGTGPLGTPIEASDSFSKYRSAFASVVIPVDAPQRVVLRIAFLTYLCDIARPHVVRSATDTPLSPESQPLSTASRPSSSGNLLAPT